MGKRVGFTATGLALLSYAIVNAAFTVPKVIDLMNEDKCFTYDVDDVVYTPSGQVKYSEACKWFLVEIKTSDEKFDLKVIDKNGFDVLKQEFITEIHEIDGTYLSLDEDVLYMESLANYLIDTEKQEYYAPKDIEAIIEMIKINYNWHRNKSLTIAY